MTTIKLVYYIRYYIIILSVIGGDISSSVNAKDKLLKYIE